MFCKNARINTPSRLANVLGELCRVTWDIVCFSETRAASDDIVLDGGHRLISGLEGSRHLGAAVLLHARLADKVSRMKFRSDRILAVDIDDYLGTKLRIISVYDPHCGYARQCTEQMYIEIGMLLREARTENRNVIVGGDFNTSLNFGSRAELLYSFVAEHGLQITNCNPDVPWGSSWTFRSSLGHLRQLDYILTDMAMPVTNSHATEELDCGSDHRAVQACMWLRARDRETPVTKKAPKWTESPNYKSTVEEVLRMSRVRSLHHVHQVVNEASKAVRREEQQDGLSRAKPWDSDRLRSLRAARRATRTPAERKALSQQISKETRGALRAWQTLRLHRQLDSFTALKKLGFIAMEPVKRKSAVQPPAHVFADSLRQVYASSEEPHSVGDRGVLAEVDPISVEELQQALRRMTRGKCADKHGVVMEMFLCGSVWKLVVTYSFG